MKLVIIGGGPAGRAAAMESAALEEEVTLIEKGPVGGTCLNEGCMVICGLNDVARFLNDAQNFQEMGLVDVNCDFSYEKVVHGVKETLNKIRHVTKKETLEAGIELVSAEAKLEDGAVWADDAEYEYDRLIIATGARPFIPPVNGSEHAITYKDILDLKELPEKLNIIGSGVIATEFAHIFSAMGCEVHILCRNEFLRPLEDDARNYVEEKLLKKVKIHKKISAQEINSTGVETSAGFFEGTVLLATGTVPNSELVRDSMEKGRGGEIRVNAKMETSAPHIYAAGDVVGGVGTTPVARMEGTIAARNALGIATQADYSFLPQAISLDYDVAFLQNDYSQKQSLQTDTKKDLKIDSSNLTKDQIAENVVDGRIPGSAGPGSFWRVLSSETGFSKTSVDLESGSVKKMVSIAPSARNNMSYLSMLLRLGLKTYEFNHFVETHPSTDSVYKLMRFFSRY